MVAPIIAMAGKKASDGAGKALTGDIYTRRWTSTRGKGKKKVAVEHELKANPLSVGIGLLAVGGAALLAGVAVWATQRNVEATPGKDMVRIVESFDATYKTVTVVEQPAYTTTYPIETPIYEEVCVKWDVIEGRRVCVEYDKVQVGVTVTYGTTTVPAVTHEEQVIDKPG